MTTEDNTSTINPYEPPTETNKAVASLRSNRTLGRCLTYGGFATISFSGCALLTVSSTPLVVVLSTAIAVSSLAFVVGIGILFQDAFQKLRAGATRSSRSIDV